MVKKWVKKLKKLDKSGELQAIVEDILNGILHKYEIKKLKGLTNIYRLRKGKIRIIFRKKNNQIDIIEIDTRGDVYKGG